MATASGDTFGGTGIGAPTAIEIGVWERLKLRGRPLVQTRCDPQMTVGSSGTPAALAIRTAPDLNSFSSNDREIVASGNTPTISPPLSAVSAERNEAVPASRSTGM